LKDLNAGILNSVAYRTRDEEGTQSPAETLTLGSGSCRDIAALFIEAVRHLGMGARAASGYLVDPDQPADDAGSSHAWAEVYLPGQAGSVSIPPIGAWEAATSSRWRMPASIGRSCRFLAATLEVPMPFRPWTYRYGPFGSIDFRRISRNSIFAAHGVEPGPS
jgi:hypothetical protein